MNTVEKKERQEKFMSHIMERSIFDSTDILEKENVMWNGITINAKTLEECQDLIDLLEKVQSKTGLSITSDYIKTISSGDMPMGAGAGFDFKNKAIKITGNTIKINFGYIAFIHEFCHAIDEKHNIWVEFEDLYKEYLSKMNVDFIVDQSNPHKIYADFNEEQFEKASKGNIDYYKILSIKEFTAVALQNVFDNTFLSENDIKEKAEEMIKKHLKI